MTTHRDALLHLLARLSFKLGSFTLASGAASDYYIDCRVTTLNADGARLTGLAMLELLDAHGLHPAAVGGLTMGADPLVTAVSLTSALGTRERLVHGFLVRKGEKAHGTNRRIEGFLEPDAPVVVLDDVCTTGASTVEAIEAARQAGMRVIGAACLVVREQAGGEAVRAALGDEPFLHLFTASDVRAAHIARMPL